MECTICKKEYCSHSIFQSNFKRWKCCDCGETGEGARTPSSYSVAMYEGKVVNPELTDDWAGFLVCKSCYEKYTI